MFNFISFLLFLFQPVFHPVSQIICASEAQGPDSDS